MYGHMPDEARQTYAAAQPRQRSYVAGLSQPTHNNQNDRQRHSRSNG